METCCVEKSGERLRRVASVTSAAAILAVNLVFFVLMLLDYAGMNIVFCLSLVVTLIIATYMFLCTLRANAKYAKFALMLQRCFIACVVLGIVGFLTLQGLILSGSRTEVAEVDCVIVLGAGIFGETPSKILASRLDSALDYVNDRNVPIIVAGGQGPGESITEAEAMYRYLARGGADENQIWKEDASTSTWENLAFSLAIMEEMGLDTSSARVAIVTNEFHLYRAKHIAGTMGLNAIGIAAETPYPSLKVLYHFREAAALLNILLFSKSI